MSPLRPATAIKRLSMLIAEYRIGQFEDKYSKGICSIVLLITESRRLGLLQIHVPSHVAKRLTQDLSHSCLADLRRDIPTLGLLFAKTRSACCPV